VRPGAGRDDRDAGRLDLRGDGRGVEIPLYVQPGASKTEVAGIHGRALRVRVAAPPNRGKANDECRRFLATLLSTRRSNVHIVKGETSRSKVVRVDGVGRERALAAVMRALDGS